MAPVATPVRSLALAEHVEPLPQVSPPCADGSAGPSDETLPADIPDATATSIDGDHYSGDSRGVPCSNVFWSGAGWAEQFRANNNYNPNY